MNILIESDSQLVINSIKDLIKVPSLIINHIIDILIQLRILIIFNLVTVISSKISLRIESLKRFIVPIMMSAYITEIILVPNRGFES